MLVPKQEKLSYRLKSEDQTLSLGRSLAEVFSHFQQYPAMFFNGPLGSGKTTIIRGIVQALPGGGDAQVSSPSFNIMNIYPTRPEAVHFDLYRLEGAKLDPESEEIIMDEGRLVLVEWSAYLSRDLWPENIILVDLSLMNEGRRADLTVRGPHIQGLLDNLKHRF